MPGRNFNVYSVKDELTGRFLNPVFIESDPEAIRWFTHVLNNTELWKENASNFSLYKIGIFNDANGFGEASQNEMIQGGLAVLKEE